MQKKLEDYLEDLADGDDASLTDDVVAGVQNMLDFKLPADYVNVIKMYNGGEGDVGGESYLVLFPLEELEAVNADYEFLMNDIPDYYLFGKDAADTGYAFHKKNHSYHSFGLMSNFNTDPIVYCGHSFEEFIKYLYNR